jgi:3-hydroxyisobutyrate dehydrogenase-like beta-hydroxyacid dehydrogenase
VLDLGPRHAVACSLKLAVNYMLSVNIELMGQVYAFGEKSGIDAAVLGTVMATLFASPALPGYSERIRARDFDDVGFSLPGGLKDVDLFLDASTDARAPLPSRPSCATVCDGAGRGPSTRTGASPRSRARTPGSADAPGVRCIWPRARRRLR